MAENYVLQWGFQASAQQRHQLQGNQQQQASPRVQSRFPELQNTIQHAADEERVNPVVGQPQWQQGWQQHGQHQLHGQVPQSQAQGTLAAHQHISDNYASQQYLQIAAQQPHQHQGKQQNQASPRVQSRFPELQHAVPFAADAQRLDPTVGKTQWQQGLQQHWQHQLHGQGQPSQAQEALGAHQHAADNYALQQGLQIAAQQRHQQQGKQQQGQQQLHSSPRA